VIDTPACSRLDRLRAFAQPPGWSLQAPPATLVGLALGAPRVQGRRRVEVAGLEAAIRGALHEDWTATRMAEVFAMSVSRFHARWVALTGLAPQAWLRRQRLAVAADLLRAGRSLEATAAAVGYASASALAFALRRDRGDSARGLRRA
jgi:AraC-like DNA-binding protein